ncbi:MAG: hypothetical protein JST91_10615 [Actinobacteria bacterium]|nr:hypothetical protein [Actinomycetota bacterium]
MPNRRRRKLSTVMSAFAALAVASPVALITVSQLSQPATEAAPQHREFVQAASIADLPAELMSALSQGLSQFGINMPPMPTGLLGGTTATPSLASPTLTTPGLGVPSLSTPGLSTPGLTAPGLSTPGLTTPGLSTPGLTVPPLGATAPSLTDPALTNPALTNPALTSPTGAIPGGLSTPSLAAPGLSTPTTALDPALTPISAGTGLPAPGEVPISAPLGLDPTMGTYPVLGDPYLTAPMPAQPASGGLLGDLTSAADQLGAGQAIDLLKGVVMPAITSAIKSAAPAAAPAAAPLPVPPAAPGT